MDRREFIKRAATGMGAIALLPHEVFRGRPRIPEGIELGKLIREENGVHVYLPLDQHCRAPFVGHMVELTGDRTVRTMRNAVIQAWQEKPFGACMAVIDGWIVKVAVSGYGSPIIQVPREDLVAL